MSTKKEKTSKGAESMDAEPKKCFVIMPISDHDGYESGHFSRVFRCIIQPAREKSNFTAVLANSTSESHSIVLHILQSLVSADMVVCDLSTANANVLYELGIRQMLGKPVALIRDERSQKIFDIDSIRYTNYDSRLRVDLVEENIKEIAKSIDETYNNRDENTKDFIKQLGTSYTTIKIDEIPVSEVENTMLDQLKNINNRLASIEKIDQLKKVSQFSTSSMPTINPATGKLFGIPLNESKKYLNTPGQLFYIARFSQPEILYMLTSTSGDGHYSLIEIQNKVYTPFNSNDSESYITRFFPENLDYKTALILFQPQQILNIQELRRRYGLPQWEIL